MLKGFRRYFSLQGLEPNMQLCRDGNLSPKSEPELFWLREFLKVSTRVLLSEEIIFSSEKITMLSNLSSLVSTIDLEISFLSFTIEDPSGCLRLQARGLGFRLAMMTFRSSLRRSWGCIGESLRSSKLTLSSSIDSPLVIMVAFLSILFFFLRRERGTSMRYSEHSVSTSPSSSDSSHLSLISMRAMLQMSLRTLTILQVLYVARIWKPLSVVGGSRPIIWSMRCSSSNWSMYSGLSLLICCVFNITSSLVRLKMAHSSVLGLLQLYSTKQETGTGMGVLAVLMPRTEKMPSTMSLGKMGLIFVRVQLSMQVTGGLLLVDSWFFIMQISSRLSVNISYLEFTSESLSASQRNRQKGSVYFILFSCCFFFEWLLLPCIMYVTALCLFSSNDFLHVEDRKNGGILSFMLPSAITFSFSQFLLKSSISLSLFSSFTFRRSSSFVFRLLITLAIEPTISGSSSSPVLAFDWNMMKLLPLCLGWRDRVFDTLRTSGAFLPPRRGSLLRLRRKKMVGILISPSTLMAMSGSIMVSCCSSKNIFFSASGVRPKQSSLSFSSSFTCRQMLHRQPLVSAVSFCSEMRLSSSVKIF